MVSFLETDYACCGGWDSHPNLPVKYFLEIIAEMRIVEKVLRAPVLFLNDVSLIRFFEVFNEFHGLLR